VPRQGVCLARRPVWRSLGSVSGPDGPIAVSRETPGHLTPYRLCATLLTIRRPGHSAPARALHTTHLHDWAPNRL
jgi:hypothetical protein